MKIFNNNINNNIDNNNNNNNNNDCDSNNRRTSILPLPVQYEKASELECKYRNLRTVSRV